MLKKDKELLRLTTAGSVDDGKSTLIGRLLYESQGIYDDQLEEIEKTSKRQGKNELDLALLTDGLSAEREQGITIDVGYRYFSTPKRRFVIADVPGHEQYTPNMVTGASGSDLAVILVDVTNLFLIQAKRHLFIVSLLNIPHVLIAVNKMDLVGYKKENFECIKEEICLFAQKLNLRHLEFIPISARYGNMVVQRGEQMKWYEGHTLIQYLENLYIASDRNLIDFRFPVQWVLRPDSNFRGYAGRIESGVIRKGEEVRILPSGKVSKIKAIYTAEGEKNYAFCPQSIHFTLEDEIDISRGNMIVRKNNFPRCDKSFRAEIFWMSEDALSENKVYLIKQTTKIVTGFISNIDYKINLNNLHREKTTSLKFNDVGRATVVTHESLLFDAYKKNRATGSFIIIDELTYETVGAGLILDHRLEDWVMKDDP